MSTKANVADRSELMGEPPSATNHFDEHQHFVTSSSPSLEHTTMRCSIIRLMFGAEAKRRKVSETEAFRLWRIDYLSER